MNGQVADWFTDNSKKDKFTIILSLVFVLCRFFPECQSFMIFGKTSYLVVQSISMICYLLVPISGFYLFVQLGILFVTMITDWTLKPIKVFLIALVAFWSVLGPFFLGY